MMNTDKTTDVMDRSKMDFDTFSQWLVWRILIDMADFESVLPQEGQDRPWMNCLPEAEAQLYSFMTDLYRDMYEHPEKYHIPEERYENFVRVDTRKQEAVRQALLQVKKIVVTCILDFLYEMGRNAEMNEAGLMMETQMYRKLLDEKNKKYKPKSFLAVLEGIGFNIAEGETVQIRHVRYPLMLIALSVFSKECAKNKEYGFYFFCKCDFKIFDHKALPSFWDAMKLVPGAYQSEVIAIDEFLIQQRYKREVMISEAWSGYRIRYKKNQTVCWCRIRNTFHPDLHFQVRWGLDQLTTSRLLLKLDQSKPGLSKQTIDGIYPCERCREHCTARSEVVWKGKMRRMCSENGWSPRSLNADDFTHMKLVVTTLSELFSKGKRSL